MLERLRIVAVAFVVAALAAPSAGAQQAQASRTVRAAGPRVELTATAVREHAQLSDSATALPAARRQNVGRPVALMIVGGAAIILGAVIGGDAGTLFMIGGAVTGLIGLYQYLQ